MVHKKSIWNSNPYGNEVVLVQQSMFRYQKFIIDEQEREHMEKNEKIENHDKARPVIAIIDSGVNVNHESFQDRDIPSFISDDKWKGGEIKVPYKRKMLALRNYTATLNPVVTSNLTDFNFAEDLTGHGTACASIAAATSVNLEWLKSIHGIPNTIIQGANPWARVASYKIKGKRVRRDDEKYIELVKASLLDAIKQAIVDKVDVISVSLATRVDPIPDEAYFCDVLNYGAYLAMKENIVLCTSAGNNGRKLYTLTGGLAPWVVTVGSCNSGGRFITNVELGNSSKLEGFDSFVDKDGDDYELIHCSECFKKKVATERKEAKDGEDAKRGDLKRKGKEIAEIDPKGKGKVKRIDEETQPSKEELEINREIVEGKMIFCDGQNKCSKNQFLNAKAAGVLVTDFDDEFRSYGLGKPIVYVNQKDGSQIQVYIQSCRLSNTKPTAKFFKSTYDENEKNCRLSYQSSRGPSLYDPYILKPDICAPGENILCASKWDKKNMYADYFVMSGTSMANAIVAGMISKIMSFRKEWEPGRIKSAIMTTAIPMQHKESKDVLGSGAGCIHPMKAVDPGLVYDVTWDDFRRYMLSRRVDKESLSSSGENVSGEVIFARNLNLPSFSLILGTESLYSFNRTLTNVGPNARCTYKANIVPGRCPSYVKIDVKPPILEFNSIGDKKHFELTIRSTSALGIKVAHARLIWTEQSQEPHTVSSPIVIMHQRTRILLEEEEYERMLPKKRAAEQDYAQKSKQKAIKLG